jgi:ketosteroid isomerase-like protein
VTEAVLLPLVQAFRAGDVERAAALLAPDVVWHSPGRRQPAAGSHRGLPAVLAAFDSIATQPGTLELEIVAAMTGSDGYETVLYRHRRVRPDATLDAAIALVARTGESRVIEVWEHIYDLFTFDEFYGARA